MIVGTVDAQLNLLIPLVLRGFNGQEEIITTILDTGFSDYLSLTMEQIESLGLLPSGVAESVLADGSIVGVTLYTAIVVWDGAEKLVEVVGGDVDSLLGVKLLEGRHLSVDFSDGGTLQIF
jgi:clan AA aspartic protease